MDLSKIWKKYIFKRDGEKMRERKKGLKLEEICRILKVGPSQYTGKGITNLLWIDDLISTEGLKNGIWYSSKVLKTYRGPTDKENDSRKKKIFNYISWYISINIFDLCCLILVLSLFIFIIIMIFWLDLLLE